MSDTRFARRLVAAMSCGIAAVALSIIAPSAAYASPTTYYISVTDGNDAYTGTSPSVSGSSGPWRTLTNVNAATLGPGDRVLFKAGDTWTGQTLTPQGSSTSSNWILFASYGTGARPVIAPGGGAVSAITVATGGFQFKDLEITGAMTGIVYRNTNTTSARDGLMLDNVYLHDLTGAGKYPNDTIENLHYGTAVAVLSPLATPSSPIPYGAPGSANPLSHVYLNNVTTKYVDSPVYILGATDVQIKNLQSDYSYVSGVLLQSVEGGLLEESSVMYAGDGNPMYWGTAGVQLNGCKDVTVSNNEIAFTQKRNAPDGIGLDVEGSNMDIDIAGNTFHDNQGSGLLIFKNPDWALDNIRTKIRDNVFINNGLENTSTIPNFARIYQNTNNGGTISNNVSSTSVSSQNLTDGSSPNTWTITGFTSTGNQSTMSTATTYNDPVFSGSGWSLLSHRRDSSYGDDLTFTTTSGATASTQIVGTGFELIAEKGPNLGNVEIYVDGVSQGVVSEYNSTSVPQSLIMARYGLSAGTHTVSVTKRSGTYAIVDAIRVQSGATLNDNSGVISYSGWSSNGSRNVGDFSDDVTFATSNGASAVVTFTGTGVGLVIEKSPGHGQVSVSLDGGSAVTVGEYAPRKIPQVVAYSVSGLASGTHTLTITKLNGAYAVLDGVSVKP